MQQNIVWTVKQSTDEAVKVFLKAAAIGVKLQVHT